MCAARQPATAANGERSLGVPTKAPRAKRLCPDVGDSCGPVTGGGIDGLYPWMVVEYGGRILQ